MQVCQLRARRLHLFQNPLLLGDGLTGPVHDASHSLFQRPVPQLHAGIQIQQRPKNREDHHHDQPGDLGGGIVVAVDQHHDHHQIKQRGKSQIVGRQLPEFKEEAEQEQHLYHKKEQDNSEPAENHVDDALFPLFQKGYAVFSLCFILHRFPSVAVSDPVMLPLPGRPCRCIPARHR